MSKFRWHEARAILCGERLGQGCSREVFGLRTNDAYVVKIETRGGSFQNVAEWETWQWVSGRPMAKWFAPCEMISPCGLLLVQRRVEQVRAAELPARLPAFLCDLKRENFGMFEGRIVCCDYGTVPSVIRTASARMVKAVWR